MGLFSSIFKKSGDWHIKQLVKESCDHVINATMQVYDQKNNPYLVDCAVNILIEHGSFNVMKDKQYANIRDKLKDFMTFYVVRNLGRDIDYLAGEKETMLTEIERYWPVFIRAKDGTEQIVEMK